MRIGEDYGLRLDNKFTNLNPNALGLLSQSYPSHGFVIDMQEAEMLFKRVREASDSEKALVERVGDACRIPERRLCIKNLTELYNEISAPESIKDEDNDTEKRQDPKHSPRKPKANGKDPASAS